MSEKPKYADFYNRYGMLDDRSTRLLNALTIVDRRAILDEHHRRSTAIAEAWAKSGEVIDRYDPRFDAETTQQPSTMTDPTDAAVDVLAHEFYTVIWRITPDPVCRWEQTAPDTQRICRKLARHVLTRQPKQEDVERLANALQNAVGPNARLTWPDFASAILALYPALPDFQAIISRFDTTIIDQAAEIERLTTRVRELEALTVEPPVGTIRLGEGLTAQQEGIIRAAIEWEKSLRGVTRFYDERDDLLQAVRHFRASATPKPDPRLDVVYKALLQGGDAEVLAQTVLAGLDALRAGGV